MLAIVNSYTNRGYRASGNCCLKSTGAIRPYASMKTVGQRIRQRFEELGITQAEAARAAGCSTARFGNYVTGIRQPDLETLARIATSLRTTTDWLLGLTDAAPVDIEIVIRRLLELDGMPIARATVISQAAEEAIRLLASLPANGDAQTRALLAAQAAWQMKYRAERH